MNAAFDKNKVPPLTTPRGFKVGETKEEGKEVLGSPTLADVKALKDHDEAGLKFDTAKVRRESRNNNSWHANTYNVPSIPFLPPSPLSPLRPSKARRPLSRNLRLQRPRQCPRQH